MNSTASQWFPPNMKSLKYRLNLNMSKKSHIIYLWRPPKHALKIDAICTFIRKVFATKNLLSGKFLVFFWLCSRPALASFLKSVRPIWCHWWWWCHPMSTSRQSHNSKSTFPKWFNQIKKSIFQELFKIFIPLVLIYFWLLVWMSFHFLIITTDATESESV